MTPPRRNRTHPDDGILEEAVSVVLDTPFADGPMFIFVGTTGDLDVTTKAGTRKTFKSVAAGVFFPMLVDTVHSAATTAGNLMGGR